MMSGLSQRKVCHSVVARRRHVVGALVAVALTVFGGPWRTTQVVRAQSQALFISVLHDSQPVRDLDLDEVVVQWNDEAGETLDLEPVNLPVRVTVLIDNGGDARDALQHMREGLKGFIAAIPSDVEIALLTIAGQPRWITRHTTDRAALTRGLNLVVPDTGTSTRYLDAWVEAAKRLDEDTESPYLPVIVMVAGDGPDGSSITQGRYDEMKRRMVDNLATWHTRMFTGSGRSAADQAQIAIEMGKVTGGTYEALAVDNAFRRALPELGRDIARKHKRASHQYRVTYVPPDAASKASISVEVTRPGLDLIVTIDGNVP